MSLKYFSVSVGGDGRYGLLIDPASIHFIDIVSKGDRTITGRRAAILLIALVYQGGDEYLLKYIYISETIYNFCGTLSISLQVKSNFVGPMPIPKKIWILRHLNNFFGPPLSTSKLLILEKE